MRYLICLLLFLAPVRFLFAQPKLVVGIVVDQMRYDYLTRYSSRFGETGFKRLQREGYSYENAQYPYIPTYTGPGHASIYTGTTPSYHGIVANDWYDRYSNTYVYCAEPLSDSGARVLSPKNLQSSTVTDQLALASGFRSKIVGVSIKDRGAILPAGHAATGAYWYDNKSGKLVTSSWYREGEWVNAFNKRGLPLNYLEREWNTLYPPETYTASAPDDNPYENSLDKNRAPVFPYDLKKLSESWGYRLLPMTPFGNSWVFEAGKAAIEGEQMGQGDYCDFLCLSFSATDYAGHFFGPQSMEIEDMYLRLDKELGDFLNYLDARFGKGNYTLFLSADHGANEVAAYLEDNRMPGGLLDMKGLENQLSDYLKEQYADSLLLAFTNEQIYLDQTRIAAFNLNYKALCREVAQWAEQQKGIHRAIAGSDLEQYAFDPVLRRLWNGYWPKRSGDVLLLTAPGWMDSRPKGTTHGSGFSYDTRVPVLFYGYGVQAGKSTRPVSICDIAPSLSLILGIQFPSANTGDPLSEMLGY